MIRPCLRLRYRHRAHAILHSTRTDTTATEAAWRETSALTVSCIFPASLATETPEAATVAGFAEFDEKSVGNRDRP
jgi:hypothetical protein